MKIIKSGIILGILMSVMATTSFANIKQLKTYRTVYPNLKPACVYCHIDEKTKKEDGAHELTPYGMKLKELMADGDLTEEMVKSIGNHEDFKESAQDDEEQVESLDANE